MSEPTLTAFRRAVRDKGGAAAVAPLLGCTRAYVDMILRQKRRPGMRVAWAIEQHFGIAMQAWMRTA